MRIKDFYPVNQWSTIEPERFNVDETTGKKYPYVDKTNMATTCLGLAAITPLAHLAIGVAYVALRAIKLISLWHFWKKQEKPCPFKARLKDAWIDLFKIFTQPLAILLLELNSFYGLARSYDARKLYCSIEQFQYDRYLLMSLMDLAPDPEEIKKVPQKKKQKKKPETAKKPLPNPDDPKAKLLPTPEDTPAEKVVLPDIKKKIADKIVSFSKPPFLPAPAMKGQITAVIINHLIECVPHVNIAQTITVSMEEAKVQLTKARIKTPDFTKENIEDEFFRKILQETLERSNFTLLTNALKSPGNESIAPRIAKELQEKYIGDFKELHNCISNHVSKGKEELDVDDVETPSDEEENSPQEDLLIKHLASMNYLNEILLLFNDEAIIKILRKNIFEETKIILLTSKILKDLKLFQNMASFTEIDPLNIGIKEVASAILSVDSCVKQSKKGPIPIDDFIDFCNILVISLSPEGKIESIENPNDLRLSVYLALLVGLYEEAIFGVLQTLDTERVNSNSDKGRQQRGELEDLVAKINILLNQNIEFKVDNQVQDDELINLIASIPNLDQKHTVDNIAEWLLSNEGLNKEAFTTWMRKKAAKNFAIFGGKNLKLGVIQQMFESGI